MQEALFVRQAIQSAFAFGDGFPAKDSDFGLEEIVHADFPKLMQHADALMERRLPIAMAVVLGRVDASLCREVREQIRHSAECIYWAGDGPLVTVILRRGLVFDLEPTIRQVFLRCPDLSVGVAYSPGLDDANDLWLAARLALQRAMAAHEHLAILDDEAAARSVAEYRMSSLLRREIQAGGEGFSAHFQPQVQIANGRPVAAEVLARWSVNGCAIPPTAFIPVAEKFGLIGSLGEMMLGHGACALKTLRQTGIALTGLAVNVSPHQMVRGDFLRTSLDVLRSEGLQPTDIELEITESLAADGDDEFHRRLGELAEAGFRIAIDDFGTGMSSLARIRELPARKLKLDRALVFPLPEDAAGRNVCNMAVSLAHSLGMTSLAEGVETRGQFNYLRDVGCLLGQGYRWARPMPLDELIPWWSHRSG